MRSGFPTLRAPPFKITDAIDEMRRKLSLPSHTARKKLKVVTCDALYAVVTLRQRCSVCANCGGGCGNACALDGDRVRTQGELVSVLLDEIDACRPKEKAKKARAK